MSLRSAIAQPGLVSAPGVFDMVSAKIADGMGFQALYMTGFGVVASHLGLPDAGIATYSDMIARVTTIVSGTTTPLIADADTGYGGLLNVEHTVRGYERAGVQAIQIEDQEFPKKCGHTPGRRVIAAEDMARKIRVAAETRDSADFLIIARTDARTALGLDEALRRADIYSKAGADILFVEAPEFVEEMSRICVSLDRPQIANMVEGGRTPVLSRADLEDLGYKIAIFPTAGLLAAAHALQASYRHIHDTGSNAGYAGPIYPFADFTRLMGFERVWAFEKRHADGE